MPVSVNCNKCDSEEYMRLYDIDNRSVWVHEKYECTGCGQERTRETVYDQNGFVMSDGMTDDVEEKIELTDRERAIALASMMYTEITLEHSLGKFKSFARWIDYEEYFGKARPPTKQEFNDTYSKIHDILEDYRKE